MTNCALKHIFYWIIIIKMDSNKPAQLFKRYRVCGDKAICFNFDVLTCGPCRLFFYRNVNICTKNWKCFITGKCEINPTNRKICRKCRMDKCVAIGMKPKQLQNDINNFLDENIEMALKNCVLEFGVTNSNEDIISLPQSVPKNYFEFNQTEMKYIYELVHSSSMIFNFEESNLPVLYQVSNIYQALNLGKHYVKQIIKYCKSNSVFRSLNEQEQLSVLKQFIKKFLKIRHAFAYDSHIGGFYALGNEDGSGSVLNKGSVFDRRNDQAMKLLIENKRRFTILLHEEMADDRTIRDLLMVQALFSCDENVCQAESLRYYYWMYNHLLLRYLQCKYRNTEKAELRHSMLIKIVHDSMDRKIVAHFKQTLLSLDRNQFDQLGLEMFNI